MKKRVLPSGLLAAALLLSACTEQTASQERETGTIAPVQSNTTASPQSDAESSQNAEIAPIAVGDGIYQIAKTPKSEKVQPACAYGIANRDEAAAVEAFDRTLDFSRILDQNDNGFLSYCVRADLSTVYFADYYKLYQADCDLQNPKFFCELSNDNPDAPNYISELIAFDNTELLFFQGGTSKGYCIGSIHPETGEIHQIPAKRHYVSVPCNTGVMLYDYEEAKSASSTVLYWECGEIREIPLQKPAECEMNLQVSANGKYICTYLWGKAQDDRLMERYSVYDAKSGKFIKSFDWTFRKKVGETLPKGFLFLNMNEETKSVYLKNTEDDKLYQFAFGEAAS